MTLLHDPIRNNEYIPHFATTSGYELSSVDTDGRDTFWVAPETYEDLTAGVGTPERIALEGLWRQMLIRRGEYTEDQSFFGTDEWNFCIIKSDAKQQKIEGEIYQRINDRNLSVVASREAIELDEAQLDKIWAPPVANAESSPVPSPWWRATVEYMTSDPVDVVLVNGADASAKMKQLKAQLRTEFYGDGYQNNQELSYDERVRSVIHTSDGNPELFLNTLGFWGHSELARIVNSVRSRRE